jgi:hypothetical protein
LVLTTGKTGLTGSGTVQSDLILDFKISSRISNNYPQFLFSIIHTLSW